MNQTKTHRPRVVVADDHPDVLVAIGRMLQSCCEVIRSVANGHDALDAVHSLRPDVLVIDLMMPDVDGLEVCRSVRRRTPDTDVVVVTAFDDAAVRSQALEDGAAAFVVKHNAAHTLADTVHRIVAARRQSPP
jgi:CheY-like chemotaxis protein